MHLLVVLVLVLVLVVWLVRGGPGQKTGQERDSHGDLECHQKRCRQAMRRRGDPGAAERPSGWVIGVATAHENRWPKTEMRSGPARSRTPEQDYRLQEAREGE